MENMFCECNSLLSLNLNNFDTSKVGTMKSMFLGCSSLLSLNINNLNTSKVDDMSYMFKDCNSLISLNLNNFYTLNADVDEMFEGSRINLLICINEEKASNII